MSKHKKSGSDGLEQMDMIDRDLFCRMFRATINVICGTVPEQKQGIELLLDILRSDVMCAKRMLRILDATPAMDRKHPEIRTLCEHTCGR